MLIHPLAETPSTIMMTIPATSQIIVVVAIIHPLYLEIVLIVELFRLDFSFKVANHPLYCLLLGLEVMHKFINLDDFIFFFRQVYLHFSHISTPFEVILIL